MDREKVIKGLESCRYGCPGDECPYHEGIKCADMMTDAIELLKEQEDLGKELESAIELIHKKNERIEKLLKEKETHKFFVDESGKITPLPVVVRCKDCKHYDETQRGKPKEKNRYYVCDDFNPEDDWFCADGEAKE